MFQMSQQTHAELIDQVRIATTALNELFFHGVIKCQTAEEARSLGISECNDEIYREERSAKELVMKTYIYWDNSAAWHGEKMFECCAINIECADALFSVMYPEIDLRKSSHIGCQIESR